MHPLQVILKADKALASLGGPSSSNFEDLLGSLALEEDGSGERLLRAAARRIRTTTGTYHQQK